MNDRIEYAGCLPEEEKERQHVFKKFNHPQEHKHPLAVVVQCYKCKMRLSMGPKLQEMLKQRPSIKPVCPYCLVKDIEKLDPKVRETAELVHMGEATQCRCGAILTPVDTYCDGCWRKVN